MKIKYRHASEPDVDKIHDTVEVLKNNPFITMTQAQFDEFTIEHMKSDEKRGIILSFEIQGE